MELYHVSPSPSIRVLIPRVPRYNNFMKHGFEDEVAKRVCFAPSIKDCLRAINIHPKGTILYVYKAVGVNPKYLVKPTQAMVGDSPYTHEWWYIRPIAVKLIKQIVVGKTHPEVWVRIKNQPYKIAASGGMDYKLKKTYSSDYETEIPKGLMNNIKTKIQTRMAQFYSNR